MVDRPTHLILQGGITVYRRVVEEALLTHPAISSVKVVGVPHRCMRRSDGWRSPTRWHPWSRQLSMRCRNLTDQFWKHHHRYRFGRRPNRQAFRASYLPLLWRLYESPTLNCCRSTGGGVRVAKSG